mgnify:CR=1 FL=1
MEENNQVEPAMPVQEPKTESEKPKKSWNLWVMVAVVVLILGSCFANANSAEAKQKRAREEYVASVRTAFRGNFDGFETAESIDGSTLTVSVWFDDLTFLATILATTEDPTSIDKIENNMFELCETMQSTATQKGTGYTIRLRLMDGSDHTSTLCIIQDGQFIEHIIGQ